MRVFRFVLRIIRKFVVFVLWYSIIIRVLRKLFHFPVPAFVGRFLDSDYRRTVQPPHQIIERSGIKPGMKVLEVGCGSGAYTTFVAKAVGEEGQVSALDIQTAMLRQIEQKLQLPEYQAITNIKLFENSAYDLPFSDGTFDVVYMITVLQEIPDPHLALVEARRVLKHNGKLAVTEFLPDPDYVFPFTTIKLGLSAGLELDALQGNLWTYTVRFRK